LDEFRDENGRLILNKNQRDALYSIGIETVEALAMKPIREIVALEGFKETSAIKAWNYAIKYAFPKMFVKGDEIWERRKNVQKLTTGSKNLDQLLGGGIETQSITEVAGAYGVGKTQLAHQLCVNVQKPSEHGGLDGNALYFDTENAFRPERIKALGGDLNRIVWARAYTSSHQVFLLNHVEPIIGKENIRLIVVDSLMAHFRSEYVGRESLAERQQTLNQYLKELQLLAERNNLAVYVTNQVLSQPDIFGKTDVPIGGNILAHASTTRLLLRKKSNSPIRIIRLIESPYLAEGETVFKITDKGIEDVESS